MTEQPLNTETGGMSTDRPGLVLRAARGVVNRLLQVVALYIPGATTTRVWLHRARGVRIGEGTFIGAAAILETERPDLVTIGKRVNIGIRAVVIAHFWNHLGVDIGDDVFIGPGAIIMPGITIGRGAVVTAGSVVSRSVPEMTMVRGNPAEPIARCGVPLGLSTPIDDFARKLRPIRPPRPGAS
jgi:serine acetyltransferase